MLTRTPALCGRWSARDFLRGRSKRGGAVHTRHTHGSKGRYKRLSSLHGLRDGRRHASNHMQGGLGIKLGGGLFGLRIPRQHMLSTMTKEEFDVEMYGHPNITNPYRDHLDEHPRLEDVMQNASLETTIVLLLPRAPRTPPRATTAQRQSPTEYHSSRGQHNTAQPHHATAAPPSSHDASDEAAWIPPSWVAVIDGLCDALSDIATSASPHAALPTFLRVYVTTLESSQCCTLSAASDAGAVDSMRDELLRAARELYHRLSQGRVLRTSSASKPPGLRSSTSLSTGHAHGTFLGTALKASPLTTSAWTSVTPMPTNQVRPHAPTTPKTRAQQKLEAFHGATHTEAPTPTAPASGDGSHGTTMVPSPSATSSTPLHLRAPVGTATLAECGAQRVLRELRRQSPTALCLCARLSPGPNAEGGGSLHCAEHALPSSAPLTHQDSPRHRDVPLRKADVDPDTTSGVWQSPHATTLSSLLRWHYNAHDPRAHSGDALPHKQRYMSLLVFLDASKLSLSWSRPAQPLTASPASSLVSESFSEELLATGFHALRHTTCSALFRELQGWSADSQWRAFVATRTSTAAGDSQEEGRHDLA